MTGETQHNKTKKKKGNKRTEIKNEGGRRTTQKLRPFMYAD